MARWNSVEVAVGLARSWVRGSSYAACSTLGVAHAGFSTTALTTASRLTACLAGAGPKLLVEQPIFRPRVFSSRAQFFDMLTLPSRKGIFSDAVLVGGLLPNRKDFTPQFSPHGLMLVPKAIMSPEKASPAQAPNSADAARLEAAKAQLSGLHGMQGVDVDNDKDRAVRPDSMLAGQVGADKTKIWRRLKIKKHKIKKRRKLNRYKND